jgi:tetratricopeptide (TPR) repeat protein
MVGDASFDRRIGKGKLRGIGAKLRRVISLERVPEHADALNNLGGVLTQAGDLDAARAILEQAIDITSGRADLYLNLANVGRLQGNSDDALRCYRAAVSLEPANLPALCGLGDLELDPDSAAIHYDLGRTHQGLNNLDAAATHYLRALSIDPAHFAAHANLGIIHRARERSDEALAAFREAVRLQPNHAYVLSNLGGLLYERGKSSEAFEILSRAVKLAPDFSEAHCNLGGVLTHLGKFDMARAAVERALDLEPGLAQAHWHRAMLLLLEGNFADGWREYEWGLRCGERRSKARPFPHWDGASLEGKTILVFAEQGVGDEIMFASCIPDLLEHASPENCIVDCDARLTPLFKRSIPGLMFPEATTGTDIEWLSDFPPVDVQVPMGSLPLHYRQDVAAFSGRSPYLLPDRQIDSSWRQRLAALGDGFKLGVSWRGGANTVAIQKRSTTLNQWAPVFAVPDVHIIDLQYNSTEEEIENARESLGVEIHSWPDPDPMKDLEGFASLISELDLVISIDNSTVHLAGAIGMEVWTLLDASAEWRWMLEREDSPWYPRMRLFRQTETGGWAEVFSRVAAELRGRVK